MEHAYEPLDRSHVAQAQRKALQEMQKVHRVFNFERLAASLANGQRTRDWRDDRYDQLVVYYLAESKESARREWNKQSQARSQVLSARTGPMSALAMV